MTDQWQYQLRVYLSDELAETARHDADHPALSRICAVLDRHDATLKCQFDAFAEYVAEAEARNIADYPLYEWTKATIEDPAKRAKHLTAFAVHVRNRAVYAKEEADALGADLQSLIDGTSILRLSRHDTNPANNPQPPERFRTPRA